MSFKRFIFVAAASLAIHLLGHGSVTAQCADSKRDVGDLAGYNGIFLTFSNIPSGKMSALRAGYAAFNDCNDSRFPWFSETQAGTGRNLNVIFHAGTNPNNDQSCGNFSGLNINLYETAYLPGGQAVDCSADAVLQDSFSHELGHALGLNDQTTSGCSSYIMGQAYFSGGVYQQRAVQASECDLLAATFYTPLEQYEDECENQQNSCDRCDPQEVGCGSPIVVVLDKKALEFSSLERGVRFDLDADGEEELTSWTNPGRSMPFLVLDRDGNEHIDDGSELFGDSTPMTTSSGNHLNGFDALAELDLIEGNADGYISKSDSIFQELMLWHDRNRNGRSERQELRALEAYGVVAIGYRYSAVVIPDRHGNIIQFVSHAFLDDWRRGETREVLVADVFFVTQP